MNAKAFFLILTILTVAQSATAQLGESFDIDRPKKYEDRKIGYENTYTKKYALPRKFLQNTTSHYNYYFNANEKLKNIIAAAKEAQKDTFDQLLPYYNYNFNYTKNQKNDLDSVIQKASGGILLHDLRSNWVDNFYLLIGKAYLLRQQYDSAEMTFNYINYEYGKKTKDKERVLTGSNSNELNGNNLFSIATKEKKSITSKIFERPPSRNEAFLWMIRTYIENEDYGSAAGLIQTLSTDPIFPKRLTNDLNELKGYLYYNQKIYDSAAHYVVLSLSMNEGKNDKARRAYLAGQLYELGNSPTLASEYYAKCVQLTLDPVMEVYARLNSIKIRKSNDPKIIENNIDALAKMGRKDAYSDYRDIIYYFAGIMELERNNTPNANTYLLKSAKYATNNIPQKNKTYLQLANIAYNTKAYRQASNYYDSIALGDASLKNAADITARKDILKQLVTQVHIIHTQDSLQAIAKLSEGERKEYLKKLLKKLRKEQGLKEEVSYGNTSNNNFSNNTTAPTNLFEPISGDWYFYSNAQKARGYNDFKKKWGNRPNVDGWRLAANIALTSNTNTTNNTTTPTLAGKPITELTLEDLEATIPLTDTAMVRSNYEIQTALLALGKLYHYELNDLPQAILTYKELIAKYPNYINISAAYYNLYLAYLKQGNTTEANTTKKILETKYANVKLPGENVNTTKNNDATKAYNMVYALYIQGKFEEAVQQKKIAEQTYGKNIWSQQLAYIEAIYYIKQRNDSLATVSLDNVTNIIANNALATKAIKLKEVLLKRATIEKELNALQVTRNIDAPILIDTVITTSLIVQPVPTNAPVTTTNTPKPTTPKPTIKDSTKNTVGVTIPKSNYIYKVDTAQAQYVAIALSKVDNIFTNEARNALIIYNRSGSRSLSVDPTGIDADNKLLLIGTFKNSKDALDYIKSLQPKLSTEVLPWLTKDKYLVLIISEQNVKLLQQTKDIADYKSFLHFILPSNFSK